MKDFTAWGSQKSLLDSEKQRPFFKEREVWFCSIGANIGFEQDGRGESYLRPVVVAKKFNNEICLGIPLTKNEKAGKFYFSFPFDGIVSTAILSQVRLIDAKRFQYKLGDITKEQHTEMKKRLIALLQ